MNSVTALRIVEGPLGFVGNETTSDLVEKIRRLEGEGLPKITSRLMIVEEWSEDLVEKVRIEFLRFMSLTLLTEEKIVPSPLVDEFWHQFILYTRDYAEFCEKHFGRFIHHDPKNYSSNPDGKNPFPGHHTKELLREHYPVHDAEIWMETVNYCSDSGGTCGGGGD